MRAEFTVFEDATGYWFVHHALEEEAISEPEKHRGVVHPTKISACRAALAQAEAEGARELHLHGMGFTPGIKRECLAKGIMPFVYWPASSTRIALFVRAKA